MTEVLPLSQTDLAHRLLELASSNPESGADSAERIGWPGEHALRLLGQQLTRWFGEDGYRALVNRARERAATEHPALSGVLSRAPDDPRQGWFTDSASATGAEADLHEATFVMVAAILALLARLVGEDMTTHMVSQIILEAPRSMGYPPRDRDERTQE